MKILCILSDGFEELEAVGTIALLRRAGIEIDIYAIEARQATGRFQLTFADLNNSEDLLLEKYDGLFIPGGPHYTILLENEWVKKTIDYFFKHHKLCAAICAGPTIFGKLGYLNGKHYTCFTSMNEDFGGFYLNQYVVVDDNLITGRSVAASIEFALTLIENISGKEKVEEIKKAIYY